MPQVATILTRSLQTESLSGDTDRLINDVLLEEGVVGVLDGSFEVAQDTGANMQIKVGSGAAGDKAVVSRDGRVYIGEHQSATVTLVVAASDPSDARIDRVIYRTYDDEADSSGNTYSDVEIVEGTPDAVPVAPALPDGAISLATFDVGAGVTAITDSDITDLREEITLRNGAPNQVTESTDLTGITSTSFIAGSPVCGLVFVAPPSGKVWVKVYGFLTVTLGANSLGRGELGWELREGSVIGSGSVVVAASTNLERLISAAVGSTTGLINQASGGDAYLVTGLTPGADYNVRTMHRTNNAVHVVVVSERRLSVEPVF